VEYGCDPRVSNVGGGGSFQDFSQSTVRQDLSVSPSPQNLKGTDDMSAHTNSSDKQEVDWRIKLGAALFGISILLPVAGIPLVATLGLSTTMTASVSGVLLVGAELLGVGAVAVMGKSGYAFIKNRVFGFLKQYGPPQKVSRGRYNVGLVVFCVPFLFGWLSPYISKWVPGLMSYPLAFAICGDILILASLLVLGGDFWDKIRSLFIHDTEVHFSQKSNGDQ
jgi:hypothetical protein